MTDPCSVVIYLKGYQRNIVSNHAHKLTKHKPKQALPLQSKFFFTCEFVGHLFLRIGFKVILMDSSMTACHSMINDCLFVTEQICF